YEATTTRSFAFGCDGWLGSGAATGANDSVHNADPICVTNVAGMCDHDDGYVNFTPWPEKLPGTSSARALATPAATATAASRAVRRRATSYTSIQGSSAATPERVTASAAGPWDVFQR